MYRVLLGAILLSLLCGCSFAPVVAANATSQLFAGLVAAALRSAGLAPPE